MNDTYSHWLPENRPVETRRAFVIWVTCQEKPADDGPTLEGRLEDVDTGREVKFDSPKQLIEVLQRCLGEGGQ
jgi:hypothetical protein